jgi:uncharacterized Zn finger protein
MYCPTCKTLEHSDVHFKADAFREDLNKCSACGTVWSVNHGTVEIVTDTQERSFLSPLTECVECDDYNRDSAGH